MIILRTGRSISDGVESEGLSFVVEGKFLKRAGKNETIDRDGAEVVDLSGLITLPGFIDTHVHGGNGFDTMDGSYEALNGMSEYKIKEGVTSFIPATVTASDEMTYKAVSSVGEAVAKGVNGARIAGLFLEGPYINPKNKGAHPTEFIKPINVPDMLELAKRAREALISSSDGFKRAVCFAVAPELPDAIAAITALCELGARVRMGHSSATLDQANEGVSSGAKTAIHTYNAMSALNHREPGMVGAALTNGELYAEIICDLVHVHPDAIKIVAKMKGPEKTLLITDCMCAGGLADGEYTLGELPVIVKGNVARLRDGALAGSTATLIQCVRNMREAVGVPLADAVTMATSSPAKSAGLFSEVGSLSEGKRADIIGMDEDYQIRFAMADGEIKIRN